MYMPRSKTDPPSIKRTLDAGNHKERPPNHGKTLLNDGVLRMKMTQNPLRVVLKILDLSFLPILVFSVSAAFRLFRCHFVKSHQSHSPLCSFFNLQKHTRKGRLSERKLNLFRIFRAVVPSATAKDRKSTRQNF